MNRESTGTREERMPTILVVDDDVDTCHNMADLFGDLGYRVDAAEDGERALEKAGRQPYELGLLDLRMPGMDGLTLCRHLQRKPIDCPRLLSLVEQSLLPMNCCGPGADESATRENQRELPARWDSGDNRPGERLHACST
jgi:CheY-like chemotaxis protein